MCAYQLIRARFVVLCSRGLGAAAGGFGYGALLSAGGWGEVWHAGSPGDPLSGA